MNTQFTCFDHNNFVSQLQEDIVAVGGEGKNICLYDITNQIEIVQWPAHSMRIKSLKKIARTAVEEVWLVSASTDGFIKVWKLEVTLLCMVTANVMIMTIVVLLIMYLSSSYYCCYCYCCFVIINIINSNSSSMIMIIIIA